MSSQQAAAERIGCQAASSSPSCSGPRRHRARPGSEGGSIRGGARVRGRMPARQRRARRRAAPAWPRPAGRPGARAAAPRARRARSGRGCAARRPRRARPPARRRACTARSSGLHTGMQGRCGCASACSPACAPWRALMHSALACPDASPLALAAASEHMRMHSCTGVCKCQPSRAHGSHWNHVGPSPPSGHDRQGPGHPARGVCAAMQVALYV